MRFIHADRERVILQLFDGTIVKVYDWGVEMNNLPYESKSRKKKIEWFDLMVMNRALESYVGSQGVHDLEFILGLCKAVSEIYR